MKKLVCVLMTAMLMCLLAACKDNSDYGTETHRVKSEVDTKVQQKNDEETVPGILEEPTVVYANDGVVNRFISEFNEKTAYEMTDISKGNIRTKFFAYANDCYIEMINANDAAAEYFSISINGGKEISERDKMFSVFAETLKVLDPLLTDDTISEAVEHLKSEQYMVNDYKISDTVTVKNYVPIVELSYGKSSCRIDVISSNFR